MFVPSERVEDDVSSNKLVVMVVVGVVVTVTAFAVAVGKMFSHRNVSGENIHEVAVGDVVFFVSQNFPPLEMVAISLLILVGVASAAVTFEIIAAVMTLSPKRQILSARRSEPTIPHWGGEAFPVPYANEVAFLGGNDNNGLGARLGAATQPSPPKHVECDDLRVTVLVPAHNEETSLPITLTALGKQTRIPDRVVVVADNCSDGTVNVSQDLGYEVYETVGNTSRKAGALNQALSWILPDMGACDVVMVMDADTSLDPRFLEVGVAAMVGDDDLTAVGGVFYGEDGCGLVGQFQRNEYSRYSLQIKARHGRVFVLTGTASLFRAEALLDVAAARGVFLPGTPGQVYDTAALTEDNELTLALKSLGASMVSPLQCRVTTEIMPTWRNLWVQRKRWQRGALENLSAYGMTRATLRYWGQQLGIGYGAVALNLAVFLMIITVLSVDQWVWFPFWVMVGVIFAVERTLTAWSGGWKARFLAILVIPEIVYDMFLQIVFMTCLWDIFVAKKTTWGHVQHVGSDTP